MGKRPITVRVNTSPVLVVPVAPTLPAESAHSVDSQVNTTYASLAEVSIEAICLEQPVALFSSLPQEVSSREADEFLP
ncbi:hypothetical protein J1N35_029249 [Gossypium stocksii]|uniref:Uncharacterized protein n=1 Tax=Gossypium stocksii TaxID=47602 RepID=A0A9D3UXJ0_9ROSI|nr:hypothetical protein J1N35_029249 [Gossypium stocksii]